MELKLPENEVILASATSFLINGQEQEAAAILLSSSLSVYDAGETWFVGNEVHFGLHINVSCPRTAYEIINDEKNPLRKAIQHAFEAVLPEYTYTSHLTARAENIDVNPDWRADFLEFLMDVNISNQAANNSTRTWNNLRFRSESEVRIAEALDKMEVLFLPNCMARVTTPEGRRNREPDFIVCYRGKWGILEVDGEPYHSPTRTVEDHRRDRYFKEHGIVLVEHFDATECFNKPDDVVRRFLKLLENTRD